MNKKILSIDFDIIMYPCIRLYNEKCAGDCNPTELWNYLNHAYDLDSSIRYDATVLQNIAKIIKHSVKNGAKLHLITEHQEIVDSLKTETDFDDTTYSIYNIDFHHDLWYHGDEDKNDIVTFDRYNCTNWLGYLFLKGKTELIEWFKAPNSEIETNEVKDICAIKRLDEVLGIDFTNFSDVYFCLSPQWVPYKYHHLYRLIGELCEEE